MPTLTLTYDSFHCSTLRHRSLSITRSTWMISIPPLRQRHYRGLAYVDLSWTSNSSCTVLPGAHAARWTSMQPLQVVWVGGGQLLAASPDKFVYDVHGPICHLDLNTSDFRFGIILSLQYTAFHSGYNDSFCWFLTYVLN